MLLTSLRRHYDVLQDMALNNTPSLYLRGRDGLQACVCVQSGHFEHVHAARKLIYIDSLMTIRDPWRTLTASERFYSTLELNKFAVKLYSWTVKFLCVLRLRIWGQVEYLNSFLWHSFEKTTMKELYRNWSIFAKVIAKLKVTLLWPTVYSLHFAVIF